MYKVLNSYISNLKNLGNFFTLPILSCEMFLVQVFRVADSKCGRIFIYLMYREGAKSNPSDVSQVAGDDVWWIMTCLQSPADNIQISQECDSLLWEVKLNMTSQECFISFLYVDCFSRQLFCTQSRTKTWPQEWSIGVH